MTARNFPFPALEGLPWALFLDLDGTLVDIADDPDSVRIPTVLPTILTRLQLQLNGALAIVSGRSLSSIDRLIEMPALDAAGCHGGEFRIDGCSIVSVHLTSELGVVRQRISDAMAGLDGVRIEHKPRSISIHYRHSDLSANDARAMVATAIEGYGKCFRIMMGLCVVDVLPISVGKGVAIARYMEHRPYRGRLPVFVGDDLTDEEGFEEVNHRGGLSIHVGSFSSTRAKWRLKSASSVMDWLGNVLDVLEKQGARI